jgi:hypothetical protein
VVAGDAQACSSFVGDADPATGTQPTNEDSDLDGISDGNEDANHNGAVDAGETDPLDADSDGDGLPDGVEDANKDGIHDADETSAALRDTDGDGIPDGVEDVNQDGVRSDNETDPRLPDTDGDGRGDGEEDPNWNHTVDPGETNPLGVEPDADQDGIPDAVEIQLGYDPADADMDDDGLLDGDEDVNANGVSESGETLVDRADTDCDGLKDGDEDTNADGTLDALETDPLAADSDGDLLSDGLERGVTTNPDPTNCTAFVPDADPNSLTNARLADTDGDGMNDGIEDANQDGLRALTETDPNNPDSDGDGLLDGNEDPNHNHTVDLGETDPLSADVDTDGDDITDEKEDANGNGMLDANETDPNAADTDGDGLEDGVEDANWDGVFSLGETNPRSTDTDCDGISDGEEDANHNGVVDSGESDPLNNDSDVDGLLDGVERGKTQNPEPSQCTSFVPAEQPSSLTSATDNDTDDDGVLDGTEDANHNGTVDPGELDPNNATDVSGVVQEVCTLDNLAPIVFHDTETPTPDIQLATLSSFAQSQDLTLNGAKVGKIVVDGTPSTPVVGFALSRAPTSGETTVSDIATNTQNVMETLSGGIDNPITQSLPCINPPLDCTWDGYSAVLGSYDYGYANDAFTGVNNILATLLPGVSGLLTGQLGALGPFKLRMQYVRRSDSRAVILGALMPTSSFTEETAYRLDDVTNGSALAQMGDETGVECETFDTQAYPKADIIVVVDNSGSMGDDQTALGTAAEAMVEQLQNALLDWRMARISTDADHPQIPVTVPPPSGTTRCYVPTVYGDPNGSSAFCTCGNTCGTCSCPPTSSNARAQIWPFIKPADSSQMAFEVAAALVRDKLMKPEIYGWGIESTFAPMRYALGGATGAASTMNYLPASSPGTEDTWKIRSDAKVALLIVTDALEQSNEGRGSEATLWTDGADGNVLKFLRGGPNNGVATAGTTEAETWDPFRTDEEPLFSGGILIPLGEAPEGRSDDIGDPRLARYHDAITAMGGVIGDIGDVNSIAPTVEAFMRALIGSASPYVLSKAPISASIKVAMEGQPDTGCLWENIPRSRINGFDYDGATRQITFYGVCRPSNDVQNLAQKIAVSYRYWQDKTSNPNGDPNPCPGGCAAPLVCNPATGSCECPGDCGLQDGCDAPSVCNTDPAVCECACPPDCGASPSNPRLTCNTATCAFECAADCGGQPPGADYSCNTATCQYECAACDPTTRPTVNSDRFECEVTTCQWTCPDDCGATLPGVGYRCDKSTCDYVCTADCGGQCSGSQTCNATACACECVQTLSCGPGTTFDPTACACICDTSALGCDALHQADPETCSCACKADCGGACEAGSLCRQSLCACEPQGG